MARAPRKTAKPPKNWRAKPDWKAWGAVLRNWRRASRKGVVPAKKSSLPFVGWAAWRSSDLAKASFDERRGKFRWGKTRSRAKMKAWAAVQVFLCVNQEQAWQTQIKRRRF